MKLSLKVLLASSLLLVPLFVFASPNIPHQFYGTVNFDNGSAPNGLLVEAKIDNVVVGTSVTNDGKYGYNSVFYITDPDGDRNTKTIKFYVKGIDSGETAVFSNGASTNLNLIMPSDTVTGNGANISLPSVNAGEANMPTGATNVVLTNTTVLDFSSSKVSQTSTNVTVGGNVVALTQKVILKSGVDTQPIVLTNSNLSNISASIPDGTKIQGPAGWDGKITPPRSGTPSGGSAPAGFSVGSTVINIGSPDGTLVFDKPVTILLTGVTGAVGYRPSGSNTWIQITNTCGGSYAAPSSPTFPGECAISNGTDTKIVTYHFTTFGSLTVNPAPTPAPSSSGSGSSSSGTPSDTTAPSISAINAVVGDTTAVITWQTNEASLSWIVYGKTTTYGAETKTTSYFTSHSVTLTGLLSATTYHYQLKSKDINENIGSYTDGTFTTLASGEKAKGDINKDNKVDIFDFNTIMVNWGNAPANLAADLDGNGKIDIFDFNLLMVNWTG